MSTFTDWNGPQGSNVRASDLIELARQYQSMLSELQAHIAANPSSTNVHSIRDYVEPLLQDCVKVADLTSRLSSYALLTDIPNLEGYVQRGELNQYATQADIADVVHTAALNSYLRKVDLSTEQVIVELQAAVAELEGYFNAPNEPVTFEHAVKTTDYFEGLIHALEQIQFTDKEIAAYIGGSDEVGVFYILGMLLDKAGTAYIKYVDDDPFSAVVNMAVTPNTKGALSVTTDCELEGLKFKIVQGTGRDGSEHSYLAIQSTEWIPEFASTDGIGKFSTIAFDVSGINFAPVGSDGFVMSNGNCTEISNCDSGKGFSFSELATQVFNVKIYREPGNPYVTQQDLASRDFVGHISGWDEFDADGVAINVPEGFHACDGTPVLPEDDVSDEFRAKFTEYPLVDYSIIKTQPMIEVSDD